MKSIITTIKEYFKKRKGRHRHKYGKTYEQGWRKTNEYIDGKPIMVKTLQPTYTCSCGQNYKTDDFDFNW